MITFLSLRTWALAALLAPLAIPASAAGLTEVTGFGSNPGNLRMFKYVPEGLPAKRPLVVALHGCRQHAADYDEETGWVKYAEAWRFTLLFPEQQDANNQRRCFNWFNGRSFWFEWTEPGTDLDRDEGEALSIKQMIDRVKADHHVDERRVFVTGLSAGGAMTAVMLSVYPEVFSGGAIIAGVPYQCALNASRALSRCGVDLGGMRSVPIRDLTPSEWGSRVRDATRHRGPWPRLSIWHGDNDQTVTPDTGRELLEQWTNVHGIDQAPDAQNSVKGYPHLEYRDDSGNTLVETYTITGMGHGVPVGPGPADDQCGAARDFVLDAGICAAYHIGKFWGLDR
jgi:poly(hydroxyalkanoate) depolymerase family esterase